MSINIRHQYIAKDTITLATLCETFFIFSEELQALVYFDAEEVEEEEAPLKRRPGGAKGGEGGKEGGDEGKYFSALTDAGGG